LAQILYKWVKIIGTFSGRVETPHGQGCDVGKSENLVNILEKGEILGSFLTLIVSQPNPIRPPVFLGAETMEKKLPMLKSTCVQLENILRWESYRRTTKKGPVGLNRLAKQHSPESDAKPTIHPMRSIGS